MRFPFFVVDAGVDVRGAFPDAMDAEALADALGGRVMTWAEVSKAYAAHLNKPQQLGLSGLLFAMHSGV